MNFKETDIYYIFSDFSKNNLNCLYLKKNYTYKEAYERFKTLENCENCKNCRDCKNCKNCRDCKNCTCCEYCDFCLKCYFCKNCTCCEYCFRETSQKNLKIMKPDCSLI